MQNNNTTTNTRAAHSKQVNQKAMNEMEVVLRTCNTPNALSAGISQVVARYGATEAVSKYYGNGLVRVEVLDKDGLLVCEYTRAMSQAEQYKANVAEAMDGDARRLARIEASIAAPTAITPADAMRAACPPHAGYILEADANVGVGASQHDAMHDAARRLGLPYPAFIKRYTHRDTRPATAALIAQIASNLGNPVWATLPARYPVLGYIECRLRCTIAEAAAWKAAMETEEPERVMY